MSKLPSDKSARVVALKRRLAEHLRTEATFMLQRTRDPHTRNLAYSLTVAAEALETWAGAHDPIIIIAAYQPELFDLVQYDDIPF